MTKSNVAVIGIPMGSTLSVEDLFNQMVGAIVPALTSAGVPASEVEAFKREFTPESLNSVADAIEQGSGGQVKVQRYNPVKTFTVKITQTWTETVTARSAEDAENSMRDEFAEKGVETTVTAVR